MDPLSIIASVIGISKSVSGIFKAIQWITSLGSVPLEFLDLQNELETVHGYLDVLRRIMGSLNLNEHDIALLVFEQIATCLKVLESDMEALHQLSNSFAGRNNASDKKVNKVNWKRHKDIIQYHRDRIRRRRVDLSAAVALLQPLQSQRHTTLLLAVQETNRTSFEALGNLIRASTEQQRPSERYNESQVLKFTVRVRQRCKSGCPCECHHRRELKTSCDTLMARILGQFFLSYTCLPIWSSPSCSYVHCENNEIVRSESATLQYVFPAWLVRRAVSISASWGSLAGHGAKLQIRIPRVLPNSHDIWQIIGNDSVPQLQWLLSTGQVLFTDTQSLLGLSVFGRIFRDSKCAQIHEFCLSLAGELSQDTLQQAWSVSYMACYSRGLSEEEQKPWRGLLRACGEEIEDERTPMHQAVLDCHSRGDISLLESAIHSNPHLINSKDRLGDSPLHWATCRNNIDAMRLLIESGAGVDSPNDSGHTPLLVSVFSGSSDATSFLLQNFDVDVNASSLGGKTPLIASTQQGRIPARVTKQLLDRGADPMKPDILETGSVALQFLVQEFSDSAMADESCQKLDLLLRAGVDVDSCGVQHGQSPLLVAAIFNDHHFAKALLERGASVELVDFSGKGLLHHSARNGTWEFFEIIRQHHQTVEVDCRINPYLEDKEGLTAVDYFKQRVEQMQQAAIPNGGFKKALPPVSQRDIEEWVRLMDDVQSCSAYLHRRAVGPQRATGVGV
ncbi:ankyrin repeat-containing domain protein [Podospora fimiseda]|uniref:Ankyrin repeat-containing domain protein n=1 Tax=Podospora fimiseda TaxID=252190 RepID=A0AAN7GYG7_9PEZI|nr:ankyrin repeat-containing domain protein [Podospora fimiseda]